MNDWEHSSEGDFEEAATFGSHLSDTLLDVSVSTKLMAFLLRFCSLTIGPHFL